MKSGFSKELFYADDVALTNELLEGLKENLEAW